MRLRYAKTLCASTVVHGSLLVAAFVYWGLPQVNARGRVAKDYQLQVAEVVHVEPLPVPPPEEQPDLIEPEASEPETLEFLPPPEPIPERTFERSEFVEPLPGLDRPFPKPRVDPEPESKPESKPPEDPVETPPAEPVDTPPPTQEVVGVPDPVEAKPTPLHNPTPRYPRRAIEHEVEGVVKLELTVAADGKVTSAVLVESSGSKLLDRAALAAVEDWRFEPGTRDGEPVEMTLPWNLQFSLES